MAKKPSDRRNYKEPSMEINLTPMMNLITILIPVLLVSTVFVEIAVINVAAPAIGGAPQDDQPDKPDKPPLNLTVTITDKGYTVAGSGGVLGDKPAEGEAAAAPDAASGPTIPIVQQATSCKAYRGTWPPPRSKNRDSARCEKAEDTRTFWVYDMEALREKLIEIKDGFPDEHRIIIAGEPDIEFESLVDVMDMSREVKDPGGEIRTLFDEVVLSPGLS